MFWFCNNLTVVTSACDSLCIGSVSTCDSICFGFVLALVIVVFQGMQDT